EISEARSGDVERAGLECGNPFAHEGATAIDQASFLRPVLKCFARDLVVVGFVRLTEVSGVGVWQSALLLHPVKRSAGIQAAGEGYTYLLADGQGFENYGHSDADLNGCA